MIACFGSLLELHDIHSFVSVEPLININVIYTKLAHFLLTKFYIFVSTKEKQGTVPLGWQGGRVPPLTAKKLPKIGKNQEKLRKKREKFRKNREKRGKIGKKRQKSGSFLLCPSWQIGLATLLGSSTAFIALNSQVSLMAKWLKRSASNQWNIYNEIESSSPFGTRETRGLHNLFEMESPVSCHEFQQRLMTSP